MENERPNAEQKPLEPLKTGQSDMASKLLSEDLNSPAVQRLEALKRRKGKARLPEAVPAPETQETRKYTEADWAEDIERILEMEREDERRRLEEAAVREDAAQSRFIEQSRKNLQDLNQALPTDTHSEAQVPPKTTPEGTVQRGTDKQRRKNRRVKLVLPLKFDGSQNVLVDAGDNQSLRLPLKLADVIRAMFKIAQVNENKNYFLHYTTIGKLYERGKIKKKSPKAGENDIQFRLDQQKIDARPAYYAQKFARDFRLELNRYLIPVGAVFGCDESGQNYYLINDDWHQKKPTINCEDTNKKSRYQAIDGSLGDPESKMDQD